MRGPLPLDEADFAAVRAAVLAKIATRRRAPWGELAALAASVVVAVLSMLVARQPMVAPSIGVRVSRPHPATVSVAGVTEAPHPKNKQRRGTRRCCGRDARTPVHLARIEIHTADPNVRIIWITN